MRTSLDWAPFDRALKRYLLQTGKTAREGAARQLRNLLIQARAIVPVTPRAAIPNFADGSRLNCRIVAWHLRKKGIQAPTLRQLKAKARALTNTRRAHARFGRAMFTKAIAEIRKTPKGASVAFVHRYTTPLTGALQPREPSARHWQAIIDRAITAAIPRAAADMLAYLERRMR
ncbi:MAG: hypothetical protein ACI4RT_09430 [Candidatus Spyradenecus sp.]